MKKIYILIALLALACTLYSQVDPVLTEKIIEEQNNIRFSDESILIQDSTWFPVESTNMTRTDLLRRVYFVHGLGGDATSWTKASQAFWDIYENTTKFKARECETSRLDYNLGTMGNLNLVAKEEVLKEINNQSKLDLDDSRFDPDPKKAFIIAHSQGGVVGRTVLNLDYFQLETPLSEISYGGLVTVASPLQGARILNNKDKILDMAYDGCMSLSEGPLEAEGTSWGDWIPGIRSVIRPVAKDIQNNGCDLISYNVLPTFFKDNMAPITDGYKVGANWLDVLNDNALNTSINSDYNNVPKVAFYGWEPQDNIFWRTINWIVNSPIENVDTWEANDDYDFLLSDVIPLRNDYFAKKQDMQNQITTLKSNAWAYLVAGSFWFPEGIFIGAAAYYYKLQGLKIDRDAWQKGVEWFDYRVNPQWKNVIGACTVSTVTNVETYYTCRCPHDPYNNLNGLVTQDPADCLDPNCSPGEPYQVYTYEFSYKENDGVVLSESAKNLPGATNKPVKVDGIDDGINPPTGSSHMQIRNDHGIRDAFNQLLDGDFGWYFETDEQ
ncbi:MAG: hypothetical protein ACOCPM_05945 [Bacteroidales bacterium]